MDLWQQLMLQVDYPMDMSRGEYVEVVINGQYSGLYMLQRRVDQKYLELEQNNILLKSLDWTSAPSAEQAFEVTYSGLDDATTNGLLQALYDKTIYDKINLENWIDVALYIQMGHLGDNCGHKNMFFLFEMGQDDFEVYLLPWDTDMSFGIGWNGNAGKIEFMYDEMVTSVAKRLEYTELKKLYPDLDKKMAQRWNEMRDGVFSTENIIATAEKYHTFMQATAAYQRDSQVWGLKNGGADSYDRLLEFIQQRMEFLDGHYAKLLQ